jgi:myo-inositol catabolism protein IolC
MRVGYQGKLFILAFDHRDSFKEGLFGIVGRTPTAAEHERLCEAKSLIWEGFLAALADGAPRESAGVLVDEELGAAIARAAKQQGVQLVLPVEKSGQETFDFEYGDDFGAHLEAFDPDFVKALVRWNPEHRPDLKPEQAGRLARLGSCLAEHRRRYLLEVLVPPTARQLSLLGGDHDAYDTLIRPYLTLQAVAEIQDAGVNPDAWKLEGMDSAEACTRLSALLRRAGRDEARAVVLGRGADAGRVEHWVRTAAATPGYAGFAIGRTIWWEAVKAWKDGAMDRARAAAAIGAAYRRFIEVYREAGG